MTVTAREPVRGRSSRRLGELMASGDRPGGRPRKVSPVAASRVTRLSMVIPAKNEAASIGELLDEIHEVMAALSPDVRYELLVIDDGSEDETGAIATEHGARVIRHPESLGNGAAIKRGIREASGDWVLMLDGDGQHPPADIPGLIALAETHDMAVGSRGGRGGAIHRNFANWIYNSLASYVTSRRIPDLTSGYRLVRADAAKAFAYLLPNTFSYPTTITLAMMRGGYSVGFHGITVRRRVGRSHIRLFSDGSRFLVIIMRIATFFAPMRVFGPVALGMAALGVCWYAYTYLTAQRLTNMTVILWTQATVVLCLGLVSEQVAALRFDRSQTR